MWLLMHVAVLVSIPVWGGRALWPLYIYNDRIDSLVQNTSISIVLAKKILQSYTKPSIYRM